MPFRPIDLDTGFLSYLPKQMPERKAPKRGGGFLDISGNWDAMQDDFETIGAGFRMESAPLAVLDMMTRPTYDRDVNFDTEARLKEDGLWNDHSDSFIGVQSEKHYLAVAGRIAQEDKDRRTLAAAGLSGMVVQLVAGLLDPTIALPFIGGLKGVKAIAAGAALGGVGAALQEVPLQMAQETRSAGESAGAVAMGTVIGGVLGSAIAFSRKSPKELGETLVKLQNADMVRDPRSTAIPKPVAAGAQVAEGEVPKMLRMSPLPAWVDPFYDATILPITSAVGNLTFPNVKGLGPLAGKSLGELSPGNITEIFPTVFNFNSQSKRASRMTAKLSDSGMELENAVAGGTVENRIRTYDAPIAKAFLNVEQAFARYRFGAQKGGKLGAVTRSKVVGLISRDEFLSAKQFREQIGRAMREGDKHDIPEVAEMAKYLRTEIYDPLFKLAKEEGLFKNIPDEVLGDSTYLNRVYNLELITARKPEFIKKLTDHFNAKLMADFREQAAKLMERQAKLGEKVEDFARPYDEVVALRKKFQEDLENLDGGRDAELADLETAISDKRSAASTFERGTPERKAALDEARALESQGGEALVEVRANRATIKRRLKNLTQAYSSFTERQQKKLDKVTRAEDLSFSTLQRLIKKGSKILGEFDNLTDDVLDAELNKLRGQFAETAARFDKNEERIAKIFDDEFEDDIPTSPFAQAAKVETQAFDKMTDVANRLGDAEGLDRAGLRDQVQEALDAATTRAQSIVERRAVRSARLAEQADNLDPEKALGKLNDLKAASKAAQREFEESWRVRGADSLDPVTGVADFNAHAKQVATETTNRILGTNMRLPGMDIILNPKDAELARTLDINSNQLLSEADGRSFLIDDIEELAMRYNRTLAPDIELHRAFGDFAPDQGKNAEFIRLNEEYDAIVARTQEDMKAGINPKTGKKASKPYTVEQIDKASKAIKKEQAQVKTNLAAMIDRARYEWGLPDDPASLGARSAKIASNINVLRFMGGVTISSLADVARPIQKHGLLRTFRDGYIPMLKGLGDGSMLRDGLSGRHLMATHAGIEVTLNARAGHLFDVNDYATRGGVLDKTLEYGSGKMGIVAGFSYWTAIMKQISGAVANARLMDSLAVVAGGEKASAKELQEAIRYLGSGGIDGVTAENLWRQMGKEGAGEKVGGQWWANTEAWDHDEKVAYDQFLYRDVSNTIITPGIDSPLFTNKSPMHKLLFQFKSFGMASTTRTLMAGLQKRDMAFMTGSTVSLAMGALSYYTYANAVGGKILTEMQNDLREGNWEKFADEAINRSGLLGFGADLQSIGAAIPGVSDKVTFSGDRTTRQGGANLYETLAGPTFGDAAKTSMNIITGVDSPTQATVHQLRTLTPLQNHSLLRRLYDQVETAAKSKLPENRR